MSQKLIIIRGNSGSGKSSLAKKLQLLMGYGTMLVPQDVIRRDTLRVPDEMRDWWVEKDYLGTASEKYITDGMTQDEIVDYIYQDVG